MNFSSLFSSRIIEERKRLGLSQAQVADLCGVSREMWGKYERAKATASSEVLSFFALNGADAQYILTGIRSSFALTPNEKLLLERYRNSSKERQDAALGALLGFGGIKEKSDFHNEFHGGVGQVIKRAESGSVNVVNMGSDKKK